MTTLAVRYAREVIERCDGPVIDPECDTPFLSLEADVIAQEILEVLERREMLFELIWSSGDIDGAYLGNGQVENTNDPKEMVRTIARLCLEQAVVDLMVAKPLV